jgi:hypothetical protein
MTGKVLWAAYYAAGVAGCLVLYGASGQWGWLVMAAIGTLAGLWKVASPK